MNEVYEFFIKKKKVSTNIGVGFYMCPVLYLTMPSE